ncbi:MAG: hypothetical protein PUD16_13020 [bacterium]|nr:hypothetical protein [bacterium]
MAILLSAEMFNCLDGWRGWKVYVGTKKETSGLDEARMEAQQQPYGIFCLKSLRNDGARVIIFLYALWISDRSGRSRFFVVQTDKWRG